MKVPTTKDGKHVLLFPEDARQNHVFDLRGAVEGRLVWEALSKFQQNPDLVARLDSQVYYDSKYYRNKFFEGYNSYEDSERIFANVSLPLVARIKPNKQCLVGGKGRVVKKEYTSRIPEGDFFKKPFGPILSFRQGYACWDVDSFNKITKRLHTDQALSDLLGKEFQLEYKRSPDGIQNPTYISDILSDEDLIKDVKNISLFYVLNALYRTHAEGCCLMQDWEPHYFVEDSDISKPSRFIIASPKLQKQVRDASRALCEEYLSEMK